LAPGLGTGGTPGELPEVGGVGGENDMTAPAEHS